MRALPSRSFAPRVIRDRAFADHLRAAPSVCVSTASARHDSRGHRRIPVDASRRVSSAIGEMLRMQSWRPAHRLLSIMTPVMRCSPLGDLLRDIGNHQRRFFRLLAVWRAGSEPSCDGGATP